MQRIQPSQRVEAQLERGRYSWIWVVPECPYCGQSHEHYAGSLDAVPEKYLGVEELATCSKLDRQVLQYGLTERLAYILEAAG